MDGRESSPREADAFLKSNRITLPYGAPLWRLYLVDFAIAPKGKISQSNRSLSPREANLFSIYCLVVRLVQKIMSYGHVYIVTNNVFSNYDCQRTERVKSCVKFRVLEEHQIFR